MNINAANILAQLGHVLDKDFTLDSDAGTGSVTLRWLAATTPPTDQQIEDIATGVTPLPSGLTFAQWLAINGGDVLLTLRDRAKQFFAAEQYDSAAIRAFMLLVLDELNAHSAKTNAILTAIDGAPSLSTLKTAVLAISDLPIRTAQQLRTTIENKLDAGDGDT